MAYVLVSLLLLLLLPAGLFSVKRPLFLRASVSLSCSQVKWGIAGKGSPRAARSVRLESADNQKHRSVRGPCCSEQPGITGTSISEWLFSLIYGQNISVAVYISCYNA